MIHFEMQKINIGVKYLCDTYVQTVLVLQSYFYGLGVKPIGVSCKTLFYKNDTKLWVNLVILT